MSSQNVKLPTMLSYKRSISQGRALMYACAGSDGENAVPVLVERVGVRATKAFDFWSNQDKKKANNDALIKGVESASTPNPQRVEAAFLPEDKPFLKVSFELKYLPNVSRPYMSNMRSVEKQLRSVAEDYARIGGFDFLAKKYVVPLVTGAWMWRNNEEAISKSIKISVKHGADVREFTFKPAYNAFELNQLSEADQASALELAVLVASALSGKIPLLALSVEAVYEIGGGCIVYPSQEMITKEDKSGNDDELSKTLYKVSYAGITNHAAMHEQKIGNALRRIDDMHGDEDFGTQSIEPLGVVSTHLTSTRIEKHRDFYSVLSKHLNTWEQELKSASSLDDIATDVNDLHFCIAVFVRGGAFV